MLERRTSRPVDDISSLPTQTPSTKPTTSPVPFGRQTDKGRAPLLLAPAARHRLLAARCHAACLLGTGVGHARPAGSTTRRELAAASGQLPAGGTRRLLFLLGAISAIGKDILEKRSSGQQHQTGPTHHSLSLYAPEALSHTDVRTTSEMIVGSTKNLALLFPRPITLALWRILDILLFFGLPVLALGIYWLQPWQRIVILLLWVRTLWRFYSRVARSNFPAIDVAISIVGVPLFVYLLIRSVIQHHIKKKVVWKGRSYNTTT